MTIPETEQPYGPQATEALRKLILGKKIEGEAVTRDIYGRIVCRVVCDKRDMNLTMIRHTSVITEITSDFSDLPEPETEEVC